MITSNGPGLPNWRSALAVVAHPDDESFGLGALLAAFCAADIEVNLLCFTHGEASTLHGVHGDLRRIRAAELVNAARLLGLGSVELRDHPDGSLTDVPLSALSADVEKVARAHAADGLLVFDTTGITGHPDHRWATRAATAAGGLLNIPVLAWTLPATVADLLNAELGTAFRGQPSERIDLAVTVDRSLQRQAVQAHPSQALPAAPLWRRLDLLGNTEHLRWLHPARGPQQVELQFTADCPNWMTAYAHLITALHDLGRDEDDLTLTLVPDEERALSLRFSGSPTILVDGLDPFADLHATAALACRLYDTPEGRRGAPSLDQVRTVLATHTRWPSPGPA